MRILLVLFLFVSSVSFSGSIPWIPQTLSASFQNEHTLPSGLLVDSNNSLKQVITRPNSSPKMCEITATKTIIKHHNSAAITGKIIVNPTTFSVAPKEPFSVNAELVQNKVPLTQANVKLFVRDQKGYLISTSLLKDNGKLPDSKAYDGVYSSNITVNNEGSIKLKAEISWTDKITGHQHQTYLFKEVIIRTPQIQLSGKFSEHVLDEDDDDLIDALVLTFAESTPRVSREYSLTVVLENNSGTISISATRRTKNNSLPLAVNIPYDRLKTLKEDGPYFVKALNIMAINKPQVEEKRAYGQYKSLTTD